VATYPGDASDPASLGTRAEMELLRAKDTPAARTGTDTKSANDTIIH